MPAKPRRSVTPGFVKTSHEVSIAAKTALEDIRTTTRRETGDTGLAEAAIVEALIMTAKRDGVDRGVLDRVIRSRTAALQRVEKARRTT
jgi:hypothetical protein